VSPEDGERTVLLTSIIVGSVLLLVLLAVLAMTVLLDPVP
jgi:hypothetical protein